MRVPNSPHSLRKVMATGKSSSEGEDSDGAAALGVGSADTGVNFRPPRPKRNKSRDDNAFAASMNIDGDRSRFAPPPSRIPHILHIHQGALVFKFWLMS